MKAILFDKISSIICENPSFETCFYPIHKGCEIDLMNLSIIDDELKEQFEEWYYDELVEKLIEFDAFADSISAHFKLQGEILSIYLTLTCSDKHFDSNDCHQMEEILNEDIISIIRTTTNNHSDDFDVDLIAFSLQYSNGFQYFDVFYDDQKIIFSHENEFSIKRIIENIIIQWNSVFMGDSALSVNSFIEMDFSDFFHLYDIVQYEFEFEREN